MKKRVLDNAPYSLPSKRHIQRFARSNCPACSQSNGASCSFISLWPCSFGSLPRPARRALSTRLLGCLRTRSHRDTATQPQGRASSSSACPASLALVLLPRLDCPITVSTSTDRPGDRTRWTSPTPWPRRSPPSPSPTSMRQTSAACRSSRSSTPSCLTTSTTRTQEACTTLRSAHSERETCAYRPSLT